MFLLLLVLSPSWNDAFSSIRSRSGAGSLHSHLDKRAHNYFSTTSRGITAHSQLLATPATQNSSPEHRTSSTSKPQQQQQHQQHTNTTAPPRKKRKRKRSKQSRVRFLFRQAQTMERKGLWRRAVSLLHESLALDPTDSHSHLALARLQARRVGGSSTAVAAFVNGTTLCPESIHLWQAFAVYQDGRGYHDDARGLFERALALDPYNPYVCHAYGLMEERLGHTDKSCLLWQQALQKTSTAALVCSLGQWYVARGEYEQARNLYAKHVMNVGSEREQTEIYLAAAWLEERYFRNFERAKDLIQLSLALSPSSSLAQVALARLEGRRLQEHSAEYAHKATIRRLANVCIKEEQQKKKGANFQAATDGRVYNAWANLEVKANRLPAARRILQRGMGQYPKDHTLIQAAGKVEERMGNFTGARQLYSASLSLQPSAPTLVAFAMLELKNGSGTFEFSQIKGLFEEALLVDPRHAPAYNAYARCVFERERDEEAARAIFERGMKANCMDVASLFHGYARLELSLGNVNRARELLLDGQKAAHRLDIGKDSPHRERALFLTHSLGILELNSNHPGQALTIFSDGVKRYGNSSQLLLGEALCEVKLGNADKARKLFSRAVRSNKAHAQAWQAWAVMEMRAGSYETAKKLFECGVKSVPSHGPLWQAYAGMEKRMGREDEARALYKMGIRNAPKHVPLYQAWASLELHADQVGRAKILVSQALTLSKRNGSGWLVAAEIEMRSGNQRLGQLLLRRGIECAPSDPALYKALGDALVTTSRFDEAREIYEKGIDVDQMYAPLYHSLAELEGRLCNVEGLLKLNKRASGVFNSNALEPSSSSSDILGSKIKTARKRSVPREVAALAQEIVNDGEEWNDDSDNDYQSFFEDIDAGLFEVGSIRELLSTED